MHRLRGRPGSSGGDLLSLRAVTAAVGQQGRPESYDTELAVAGLVGSVARSSDFDHRWRPRRDSRRLRELTQDIAAVGLRQPIDVVRLGELYFVAEGHHRVAAVTALGRDSIPARVRWVCTTAFACACLREVHLASKAAERCFLQVVPLPDEVTRQLWLDDPADWARLTELAQHWIRHHAPDADPQEAAHRWWHSQVVPIAEHRRITGVAAPGSTELEAFLPSPAVGGQP